MNDEVTVRMDELLAHRQWVRSLARRLAADESSADDLEQDTWLAAVRHPPRDARSVRGWLGTVVRNLHRNSLVGEERRERREAAARVRDAEPGAPELVAEAETQHALVREVLDLDEPYRSTVLLRWYEDLTPTQIAQRTGVSVDTVKTRLRRALERLRERMDDRHGGDRKAWCLLALGRGDGDGTATGTTATLTGAAGGMAMGAAAKAGIAAAVLVAVGAFVWWTKADVAPPAAPPAETAAATPTPAQTLRPSRHEGAAAAKPDAAAASATPMAGVADVAHPDRDLDLHGVVVGPSGAPVAGAKVQVVDYPWRRAQFVNLLALFEARLGAQTMTSDAGAFALRLRRGEGAMLRVSAPGLATRETGPYQAGQRVRLAMTPAVKLNVSVRDASGAPIAGAVLWLVGMGKGDEPWFEMKATTAADGTCSFDGLPGGAQAGFAPLAGVGDFGQERITLPASGEKSIEIVSPAGKVVTGRVFDAVTLSPIQGARIGVGLALFVPVTTDGGGRFEFRGWTGKAGNDLHVLAPGYARACIVPSPDAPLDIPLQRAFSVTGRIVGANGAPLPGAFVGAAAARNDGKTQQMSMGSAVADAEGRYRIDDLDRTLPHTLTAFANGWGRIQQALAPPQSGDVADVGDVSMPDPRAIEGRVLGADGAPVPGVEIRLSGPGASVSIAGIGGEERRTDDLGRFRFADLGPGDYTVERRVPSGSPETRAVKLAPDRDALDVVFESKPSGGAVEVVVTDESGAPVAGISVQGRLDQGPPFNRPTDAAGRATLDPPKGRIIDIVVSGYTQGFLKSAPVVVEPGSRKVAVSVERAVSTTCRVLDADGAPLARASITVEPPERGFVYSRPGPDGAWTDEEGRMNLVLGRNTEFTIVCHGVMYDDKRRKLDSLLEARTEHVVAQSSEITLRCTRIDTGRTASVRVIAADGSPAADVEVTVTAYAAARRTAKTDADGRASFDGLPARAFKTNVTPPNALIPVEQEFVPSGQEITLRIPASAEVSGVVVWSTGEPAAGATVRVLAGETVLYLTKVAKDGRFAVRVPSEGGSVRLTAMAAQGMAWMMAQRDISASDRDIKVEIKR